MSVLKKEFIDRMAENGGITKKEARRGFDLFIETLMDCMCEDEMVKEKRMPFQGDDFIVPEHEKMKFYPSRLLGNVIEKMRREE